MQSIVDKAGSQEMAQIGNTWATQNLQNVLNKGTQTEKTQEIKRSLDLMSDVDNLEKNIMTRSLNALSTMGVVSQLKSGETNIKGLKEKLRSSDDSADDRKELLSSDNKGIKEEINGMKRVSSRQKIMQWAKGKSGQGTEQSINEFASLSSKMIMADGNPDARAAIKRRIDEVRAKLEKEGMTGEEFRDIQTLVRGQARKEIALLIKDAFLKRLTTPQKSIEWAINEKGINSILDFAFLNESLGGHAFGGYDLQKTTDKAKAEAEDILRSVVLNEFEKDVARDALNSKSALGKEEIGKFIELANRVGVDLPKWTRAWEDKKWDLGLQELPENVINMIGKENDAKHEMGSDGKRKQQQEEEDETARIEMEKSSLIDQARAVFTERYLNFTWATFFRTSFKLRSVTSKLKKLGFCDKEIKEIKDQALGLARIKLIALIKEAYMERVLLVDESKARIRMVSKRLNSLEGKLRELGITLGQDDIRKIKAEIESTVYESSVFKLMNLREKKEGVEKLSDSEEKELVYLVKLVKKLEGIKSREKRIKDYEANKGSFMASVLNRRIGKKLKLIDSRI